MKTLALMLSAGLVLAACKPAPPPPDILKSQHQALDQAKALDGQLQQQLQDRMKAADDQQK